MAEEGQAVSLNCYDITGGMARNLSRGFLGKQIDGIWHTGIVVFGREYFWSGEIYDMAPGRTPFGTPTKTIQLGTTFVTKDVLDDYVNSLRPQYTPAAYSLISNNCNNFTNEINQLLTGNSNPPEIMQQAEEIFSTPAGAAFKPIVMQLEAQLRQSLPASGQPYPAFPNMQAAQNLLGGLQPSQSPAQQQPQQQPKPLLSCQGSVNQTVAKLLTVKRGTLTPEEEEGLNQLRIYLPPGVAPSSVASPPPGVITAFFDRALSSWPYTDRFYALFLFRLFLLASPVARYYASLPDRASLQRLLVRSMAATELLPLRLLAVAAFGNLFATQEGRDYARTPAVIDAVLPLVLPLVSSDDASAKQTAAGTVYNYSLVLDTETGVMNNCSSALVDAFLKAKPPTTADQRALMALEQFARHSNDVAGNLAANADFQGALIACCAPENPLCDVATRLLQHINA
eukprot:TRINITY_DN206_c0_g2_i1.p1 TRINITY_DN206_c0_g2~~TRINITY_DN206_c0_g2_i1.p1  ORF type:complete len:469 (+),score=141.37 TRINITY_DN206_c0_g2_i1:43-1407(+)